MKATTFIAAEQFGHASGSASADAQQIGSPLRQLAARPRWKAVRGSGSGAPCPAVVSEARVDRRAREAPLGQPAIKEGEQRPLDLRAPEVEAGGEAVVVDLLEGLSKCSSARR